MADCTEKRMAKENKVEHDDGPEENSDEADELEENSCFVPNVEPGPIAINTDDDESCRTMNEPVVDLNLCNIGEKDSANGQELDVSLKLSKKTVDRNFLHVYKKVPLDLHEYNSHQL